MKAVARLGDWLGLMAFVVQSIFLVPPKVQGALSLDILLREPNGRNQSMHYSQVAKVSGDKQETNALEPNQPIKRTLYDQQPPTPPAPGTGAFINKLIFSGLAICS